MESKQFYETLPGFSNFLEITANRHYEVVPADWHVVVTDVKGSTRAIEEGRYKDVNTLGAASISVVMEALGQQLPFVFGGDGATLLVHEHDLDLVLSELAKLQQLGEAQFQLALRVGQIPVAEILECGLRIEVAKFELAAGRSVALFRGGGLAEAERRIKESQDKVQRSTKPKSDLELKGLSCRWSPVKSSRGRILALLVQARRNPEKVYGEFLATFSQLYDGNPEAANPVNPAVMQYKSVAECSREEARFQGGKLSMAWLKRLFQIVAAVLVFKHGWPALIFNSRQYLRSLPTHSDHRKFDDMIRMVIDCTPAQEEAIVSYLKSRHSVGELYYGIHVSSEALMTCYVREIEEGGHIHFIDGGNGGYAMAAKQLKQQILGREAPANKTESN